MSNSFTGQATVVRDAERRYLPSGKAVLNVTVVNNQGYKDKQTALFIRVAVWGAKAESSLIDYLKKGQLVLISGELSQSEYTAADGTTKTNMELNATILDLIGKKGSSDSDQQQSSPSSADMSKSRAKQASLDNDELDELIPF